MSVDLSAVRQVMNEADCLYDQAQVEAAIGRMAGQISQDLAELNPLLICVMNGGLILSGKLLPLLHFPLQVSYLHATRYGSQERGGELLWKVKPGVDLADREVLIVDDILDEGRTLGGIVDYCVDAGARRVRLVVLLEKDHRRKERPDLVADYRGLVCPDRFVFGYGMDYHGYWRNAPGVYAVKGH